MSKATVAPGGSPGRWPSRIAFPKRALAVRPFRRQKLTEIRTYLAKRVRSMNYGELRRRDLELGSGQVEGAIKALMYRRMDQGGMRWIKERAEALLQLR